MAGIEVRLYNAAGQLVATTVTDGNGNYLFTELPADAYFVEFVLPEGYAFSPPGALIGNDSDSNADPTTGQTGLITLPAGAHDLSWDAGIYQKPTSLEDEDEPDRYNSAVYLPLIARTGLKIKPKESIPKASLPCQQQRCIAP